ncbi:MAG: TadE/TadG family type IV pilus assembly protein [Castellaniella sp.]
MAVVEFTLLALPILMLGMGSVELAHWAFMRQGINLALLEAGRAAITAHNRPERIIQGFEQALRPLYVSASQDAARKVHGALAQREQALGGAPWQIEVLSPSAGAFMDFADPALQFGAPAINNHYLAEQAARHTSPGPVSGQSIHQANTLVLRLSWPHRPRQPWLARLLRPLGNPDGSYRQRALARGYLPMARQITLLMQSHPVQWADHPSGKVLYRSETGGNGLTCRGWLCHAGGPQAVASAPQESTPLPIAHSGTPGPGAPAPSSAPALTPAPSQGEPLLDAFDPACGPVLCCS